uniref:Uncharacterized protein n=1 Tax=Fagus sylvatica TaxID=28930 RepID=A0A2N9IZT2_FAGSY
MEVYNRKGVTYPVALLVGNDLGAVYSKWRHDRATPPWPTTIGLSPPPMPFAGAPLLSRRPELSPSPTPLTLTRSLPNAFSV